MTRARAGASRRIARPAVREAEARGLRSVPLWCLVFTTGPFLRDRSLKRPEMRGILGAARGARRCRRRSRDSPDVAAAPTSERLAPPPPRRLLLKGPRLEELEPRWEWEALSASRARSGPEGTDPATTPASEGSPLLGARNPEPGAAFWAEDGDGWPPGRPGRFFLRLHGAAAGRWRPPRGAGL